MVCQSVGTECGSVAWLDHVLFMYSWVAGCTDCFHFLAVRKRAATRLGVRFCGGHMCLLLSLTFFKNSFLVALGLHCYEGVSLVAASRATLGCCARASHCRGLSCCRAWAPEHMALFVARGHVESSQTRDQTHVPCIGRWILKYWATREVPDLMFYQVWVHALK